VNIILITHSPFILSDIPLPKVLFLEEGRQKEKKMNTFGGNIGEMLYDSFFMDSTIGAFAEEKIKRLIKIKKGINPVTNKHLTKEETKLYEIEKKCVFDNIGDVVLKSLIK
jgi:hypothetical protein